MNPTLNAAWQDSLSSSDIYPMQLEYPPTEYAPSCPPTPLPQPSISISRPNLRVITEPGCYVFPLRSAANLHLTHSAGGYASESDYSSPISGSSGTAFSTLNTPLLHQPFYPAPAPPVPTAYMAQPSASVTVHPAPSLPQLLPNPHFRFPTSPDPSSASSPQSVAIPPATESEVQQYCPRKAPAFSSSPVRRRQSAQTLKPKPLSPASSLEELASDASSSCLTGRAVSHPYARIYAKRDPAHPKQRKMWNHALEKSLFTPDELANMKAPIRRKIYMASLEAHIDALLAQLYATGQYPVSQEALEPYYGLNCKTVKSMVSGLYKDADEDRVKLLELQRANDGLRKRLRQATDKKPPSQRRHSVDGTKYTYPNLFNGSEGNTIIS